MTRERDDDGPWCVGCKRSMADDEEEEDWDDGYCPDCSEPTLATYPEDADPMAVSHKAIAEHCREEVWAELFKKRLP